MINLCRFLFCILIIENMFIVSYYLLKEIKKLKKEIKEIENE